MFRCYNLFILNISCDYTELFLEVFLQQQRSFSLVDLLHSASFLWTRVSDKIHALATYLRVCEEVAFMQSIDYYRTVSHIQYTVISYNLCASTVLYIILDEYGFSVKHLL